MPVWTVHALNDLRAQLAYIAQDNPEAARRTAIKIEVSCTGLDQFPRVGREGAVPDTRELVIPGTAYVCVYRLSGVRVEILRLLHTRMMWPE
ncbi:type II toxin-antitoxin system RelE/ParE family toxin [Fundidesulfovibrio soli]|uniref:type II toxin-antitoxin system RelE/ParE family toxin n=1 Tax=Fundidesulfovibrio soli TaxID=2922716 RepID=UPI0023511479|nr:type II toxin-antitoxin system RelE/ParE family toxin [Fundidesulfovibrio soli]